MPNFFGVPVSRMAFLKKRRRRRAADTPVVDAPVNTEAPEITGEPYPDEQLSVSNGTWDNSPTSYTYQWFLDDVEITGATANTYTVLAGDVGGTVTAAVTAINAGGSATATSAGLLIETLLVNTVLPVISGTMFPGETLTVSNGTWDGSPEAYEYQWYLDGVAISGATTNEYVGQTDDVGEITATVAALTGADVPADAVNTVLPSISGTTNVGETLTGSDGTWTGASSFTRQWERDGVPISGATNTTYVLVDADFGKVITYVVTAQPGDVTAESAPTAAVAEVPVQTLGAEAVSNGTMEAGSPPTGWTAGGNAVLASESEERTGGAGTKSLRVTRGASGNFPTASQTPTVASGSRLEISAWMRNIDAAGLAVQYGGASISSTITATSWTRVRALVRAASVNPSLVLIQINSLTAGQAGLYDDVSLASITGNDQLTAPSANMDITQFYTLPASPVIGTRIRLHARISNFASGDYLEFEVIYTGTQWNGALYSYASHTRSAAIASVTNIGATNGMRLVANGTSLSIYTTANSGGLWTQRDTTKTSSLYQGATGVNAEWTSDITPGQLTFANP